MDKERRKMHDPFVLKMHKDADAQRKRDEERLEEGPRFFRKDDRPMRASSEAFWKLWH